MSGVSLCSERVAATDEICSPNVIYSQAACQGSLLALQDCLPGRQHISDVYISTINQEEMEMQANQLLNGSNAVNPSSECRATLQPFLCLYLFGLCSYSGVTYQPSFEECKHISTNVCLSEWAQMNKLLMMLEMPTLPECTSFPSTFSAVTGRPYHIAEFFRGSKLSRISQFCGYSRNFSLRNLGAWYPLARQKRAICAEVFSAKIVLFTNSRKFSPSKVSRYTLIC